MSQGQTVLDFYVIYSLWWVTQSNSKFDVLFLKKKNIIGLQVSLSRHRARKGQDIRKKNPFVSLHFTKYLEAGSDSYKMYAIYDFLCCRLWEL